MKEKLLEKYYGFKMAGKGYKLIGHKSNLYYGVNRNGKWIFYLTYGFQMISLKTCNNKLEARFTYNILLNDLK